MKQMLIVISCAILGALVWLGCVVHLIERSVIRIINDQPALAKIIEEGVKEAIDEYFEEEQKKDDTSL